MPLLKSHRPPAGGGDYLCPLAEVHSCTTEATCHDLSQPNSRVARESRRHRTIYQPPAGGIGRPRSEPSQAGDTGHLGLPAQVRVSVPGCVPVSVRVSVLTPTPTPTCPSSFQCRSAALRR